MRTAAALLVSRAAIRTSFTSSAQRAAMTTSGISKFSTRFHSSSTSLRSDLFGSDVAESFVGNDIDNAINTLHKADAVCFDVDSTVISEEGIDVLGDFLGKADEVSAWTLKAMEGDTKFEDALAARLEILTPSRQDFERLAQKHPLPLTPGIEQLVRALQKRDTHVWLVSGGFRIMIEPVADILDIPHNRIYANTILFNNDGSGTYQGFDADEPTSRDMGKPKALSLIEQEGNYKNMVMVGDGATDAQAKPPAKAFIGFGGVVTRAAVRDGACWFVDDFDLLTKVVEAENV